MKTKTETKRKGTNKVKATKKELTQTYNEFKVFEGQFYTGMKIGRRHKWYYDQGIWNEKKVTPDNWEISYDVKKRRAGKAPEGSGVPVGTEYHWYIMAHQNVRKLNANVYSTAMTGIKFKLAHKKSDKNTWSSSEKAQRNKLLKLLKEMIIQLEAQREIEESEKIGKTQKKKSIKANTLELPLIEENAFEKLKHRKPISRTKKPFNKSKKMEV